MLVIAGCNRPGEDRKPGNAPSAPNEQAVLHDAMDNSVPTPPQQEPAFTNGVRGAPGVTVDQPGQGAGANTGTGATAGTGAGGVAGGSTGRVAPPAVDAGAGGGRGGAGAGTNR